MNRPSRIASIVVGGLALLLGLVWTGQGAGLLAGSSMTGQRQWLYIGLALAVLGVVLLVRALRRPPTAR